MDNINIDAENINLCFYYEANAVKSQFKREKEKKKLAAVLASLLEVLKNKITFNISITHNSQIKKDSNSQKLSVSHSQTFVVFGSNFWIQFI